MGQIKRGLQKERLYKGASSPVRSRAHGHGNGICTYLCCANGVGSRQQPRARQTLGWRRKSDSGNDTRGGGSGMVPYRRLVTGSQNHSRAGEGEDGFGKFQHDFPFGVHMNHTKSAVQSTEVPRPSPHSAARQPLTG